MGNALQKDIGQWRQLVRLYALRLHRVQLRHGEALRQVRTTQQACEEVQRKCQGHEAALMRARTDFMAVSLERPLDASVHLAYIVDLGRSREALRHQEAAAREAFEAASRLAAEALREVHAAQTRCDTANRELRSLLARAAERFDDAQV